MSDEIVKEGSDTGNGSTALNCRPGVRGDMPSFGLFMPRNTGIVDLIGGNHQIRHFVTPEKGHKYVTQLNPTFPSVKPLLAKMKEPSVLCLRGCELLLRADFPFAKFRSLTALEISGCTHLTTLPQKEISEMTQLQTLDLSHLPIQKLPHDFFSSLTNLRSLVLRGCSSLHSLPETLTLPALECLDLSYLLIGTLPDGFFSSFLQLRWLNLRGCCKLSSLPSIQFLRKLEVLDLSHCTTLQVMADNQLEHHVHLKMLDLSYTALPIIPRFPSDSLSHIFLRDTKVKVFKFYYNMVSLKVLDLSGAQNLKSIDELLGRSRCLVAIDLSRTGIESTNFFSFLSDLRSLTLRECTRLVNLSEMREMIKLEVLDLSGCEMLDGLPEDLTNLRNLKELDLSGCSGLRELREGLFDQMPCLEKLDLSKTRLNHLPSFASLTNLQTLNLSQTSLEKVPNLSNLINLKEFVPPEKERFDFTRVQTSGKGNFQENEFHLVSTFISDSGFDRFKFEFKKLDDLISNIEKSIKPLPTKSNFRRTHADLKYILGKIDLLESSRNCSSSEELLLELMNAADNLSVDDFPLDSSNFTELVRVVAKLKLLVPPPPHKQVADEEEEEEKKRKPRFTTIKYEEEAVSINDEIPFGMRNLARRMMHLPDLQFTDLHHPFESLSYIQRRCLLYFAVCPCSDGFLKIKESLLLQLWYGEGFIDPTTYSNTNPETGATRNKIKEMGQQVLEVLKEKGLIESWGDGIWYMQPQVHAFVKDRAKEVRFFNFDESNGKLSPQLSGSQRACLLKSQAPCPSSCKLWLNSDEKLEGFEKIHTLLYVDEPIVYIKTEWFSRMRNLIVLHLASLLPENEEQIDIVDLKFLEELKNMKQLRLLSLEGFTALKKLSDSVCKLTNLRMLNLGYCSNLEQLPAGIGSLQNLTHLDLTECHLLSDLPKGVRLLSKLEVLKGFVITYTVGGRQHTNACTLGELLKLENLEKLNLVVNKDRFPSSKDVQVFREMKSLSNLKITWTKNYDEGQEAVRQYSRWQQLKCWKQQSHIEEEPLRRDRNLDNLKKLVLCCFPLETAPNWLHQGELQKLEKLYIVGGNLKTLPGDMNRNPWNIRTLHLKYLPNLEDDGELLKHISLNVTENLIHKCPLIEDDDS